MLKIISASLISILLYCPMSLSLTLQKKTINAGGQLAFPMSIDRHNEFILKLKIAPYFGIFLTDNFELRHKLEGDAVFTFSSPINKVSAPVHWGISTLALYYFDTSSRLFPYVGGGLGIKVMDWNLFSLNIAWEIDSGVLIELTDYLALDAGLVIQGLMSLRSAAEKVTFTPAFLGFRYFI